MRFSFVWLALALGTLLPLVGGCHRATAPEAPSGTYTLRAFHPYGAGPDQRPLALPAAVAITGVADTLRVLGGTFELLPGRRWRMQLREELVSVGAAPRPVGGGGDRTGEYVVTDARGGRLKLDLYPGLVFINDPGRIAVVVGDTVYAMHGTRIFVR